MPEANYSRCIPSAHDENDVSQADKPRGSPSVLTRSSQPASSPCSSLFSFLLGGCMEQHSAIATPVIEAPAVEHVWPTFDHHIELDEARELISRYRRANPAGRSAVASTRVPLDRILAQPG